MKKFIIFLTSFFALLVSPVFAGGHGVTKVALVPGGPHPYFAAWEQAGLDAVSYTHLTLPTKRIV